MFKLMGTVLTTKRAPQEEIEKIPEFLFRRWLSNNPNTITAVNFFNVYSKVPVDVQYDVFQTAFGGKIKFIQFPKNEKLAGNQLETVSKFYNVSKEKALDMLQYLTEENIKEMQAELDSLIPKKGK